MGFKIWKRRPAATSTAPKPETMDGFFKKVQSGDVIVVSDGTQSGAYKAVGWPTADGLKVQWVSGPPLLSTPLLKRPSPWRTEQLTAEIAWENPTFRR